MTERLRIALFGSSLMSAYWDVDAPATLEYAEADEGDAFRRLISWRSGRSDRRPCR